MPNFLQLLEDARRKAQLRGMPVSPKETEYITAEYSEQASSRLAKIKALELEKQKHEETTAMQKSQFEKRMAQQREDRKEASKASRKAAQASGATTGAIAGYMYGAEVGTAISPGWGTVIGAGIGFVAGSCIIISACTSKHSHEVEIAREFRDKYMSDIHLGGYYALAHTIAPLIDKSHFLKLIFKKFLVDRLVDYGEWILGHKPKRQLRTSRIITEGFLKLCAAIGMQVEIYPFIQAHR